MHIETPSNLIFDDTDPRCFIKLETGPHGIPFAFVQCVDSNTGEKRRYWGHWSYNEPEQAMTDILNWGGKWPNLPPQEQR